MNLRSETGWPPRFRFRVLLKPSKLVPFEHKVHLLFSYQHSGCGEPESVWWAIRRLGIPSGRINKAGNGIELNVSTCRLIHTLAQSHGVRAMQGGLPSDCRYCRELQTMIART